MVNIPEWVLLTRVVRADMNLSLCGEDKKQPVRSMHAHETKYFSFFFFLPIFCFSRNLSKKYQPKKNSREEEENRYDDMTDQYPPFPLPYCRH